MRPEDINPAQPTATVFAQGLLFLEDNPEATWVDLVEKEVMPASALLSPERVLSFPVDASRTDLVAEFRRSPLGPYSPDLRTLLWTLRSATPHGRYLLYDDRHGRHLVIRLSGTIRPAHEVVYECSNPEDAEWAVFALRWNDQTGGQLPLRREAG